MSARGMGRWSKLAVGTQVLLASVLAVAAALTAIGLSDWRYLRVDLSASGRNTLDEALVEIVDRLPEPVTIDVFFRPLEEPYAAVSRGAQNAMLELLFVARNARRGEIDVRVHDLGELEQVRARQGELGVEGVNVVVVSCGSRRTTLQLFGELAVVDWGTPTLEGLRYLSEQGIPGIVDPRAYDPRQRFEPARMTAFRGGEALGAALLKVASGRAPRVYFSTGHGEPALEERDPESLARLRAALERDGFEVATWDPVAAGGVPADCDVLAVVGPRQPFRPADLDAVRSWVAAGGRLIAAPAADELARGLESGAGALLFRYGMILTPGIVCEAVTNQLGERIDGLPECATLVIGEAGMHRSNPLTESLRRRGRRVQFRFSPSFTRGGLAAGDLLEDLVSSPPDCWRELPNERGQLDFAFDRGREERGRFPLIMLARKAALLDAGPDAPPDWRVLGIASATFLTTELSVNQDFLLNAFNWLTERDYRVRVSPRDPRVSVLDVRRGSALSVLSYVLWIGLPGLCLAVGATIAWRRRRG